MTSSIITIHLNKIGPACKIYFMCRCRMDNPSLKEFSKIGVAPVLSVFTKNIVDYIGDPYIETECTGCGKRYVIKVIDDERGDE